MTTRKITDAAVEPLSLAEVKAQLKITDSAQDATLTRMISAWRIECENSTHRTLIDTTLELTQDAFTCTLQLLLSPTIEVTSVKYLDTAGAEQTLAPADYLIDLSSEPARIVPAPGKSWPCTACLPNAVRVRYRAGYGVDAAAVPAPMKDWIMAKIQANYDGCDDGNAFVDRLLDGYRLIPV